jgi:hypothetical protein
LLSSMFFDYIYKFKMTHKKGDMTLDYYLKEGAQHFGFDSEEMTKGGKDTKMFMVMDNELHVTAMFMEMMGKKVVQKTKLKASDFDSDDYDMSDMQLLKFTQKLLTVMNVKVL